MIKLRAHQSEALDSIIGGLTLPSGAVMSARGLRGLFVSATGTGKTITAATAARRLVPNGRVGWMVPTLDLLAQTVQAWRAVGNDGPAVAVCSLGADPLLEKLGVRCTTNPTRLALWAGSGPVAVFATYASLAPQGLEDDQDPDDGGVAAGVLEQAMRGSYEQVLAPFDLLVVDEAHRTSGDAVKAWAAVLDNARIPAGRRLFMTATPTLWEAHPEAVGTGEPGRGAGRSQGRSGASAGAVGGSAGLVASMDSVALYGPVLHELGLMEAVERGILAGFELDVLEIRDPQAPGEGASVEEVRGRRLAALQAALLKHMDATGTRSLLTFHSRTLEAMAFARALPETAAELHETNPAVYPGRVGAEWLCGEHEAGHRRAVLDRFADGLDADGWVTDVQILASCRVLSEGIDIRGKRGVDGVVFADTRSSTREIVQITGRGLRQDPGEGKVARLVVPVFLRPGEDPQDMMASASYRPLVAVLQGLRAHDERIAERLMLRTTTARGAALSVVDLDPENETADEAEAGDDEVSGEAGGGEHDEGQEDGLDEGPDEGDGEPGGGEGDEAGAVDVRDVADIAFDGGTGRAVKGRGKSSGVPLLRFSLPRSPDVIAAFLRTRVLRPDSEVWLSGLNALRRWVEEAGEARVPLDATVDAGGAPYPLGAWVSEQRRAFKAGTLKPWRVELLDELGMVWSVADATFMKNLTAARTYFSVHSTLAAPKDAAADGVAVGQWLANCRKAGGLGANPERAAERRRLLESIDPDWAPAWPIDWQRAYTVVRQLVDEGETLASILPGVRAGGEDIGRWIQTQRDGWERLSAGQRERLTTIGITPAEPAAAEGEAAVAGNGVAADAVGAVRTGVNGLAAMSAFQRGVAALAQYQAREGHVRVPRQHAETLYPADPDGQAVAGDGEVEVRLGVWLSNIKSPARRTKLTADQLTVLAGLGLKWARSTLLEWVVADSERVLGPQHPDSVGAVEVLREWRRGHRG